jgi:hypothetical protein
MPSIVLLWLDDVAYLLADPIIYRIWLCDFFIAIDSYLILPFLS